LFAEAEIVVDPNATVLTVPAGAVTEFAGIEKVWVVENGQAAERAVRIGRREPHRVEILDGLEPGHLIVRNSQQGHAGDVIAVRDTAQAVQSAE
jgi:hypothetical protein